MSLAMKNIGFVTALIALIACCCLVVRGVDGARILGVFPTGGRSHYITASAWMRGLAAKGHDVTVVTPFEQKPPLPRYRVIHVPEVLKNPYVESFLDDSDRMGKVDIWEIFSLFFNFGLANCRLVFGADNFQKLLTSPDEHFDVIIVEVFMTESFFGLAEHFNAPLIAFSSFGATAWHTELVGAPAPASVTPYPFLKFSGHMPYWQRLLNIVTHGLDMLHFHRIYMPRQEELYRQYFPNSKRSLTEARQNVALVVLNQHFSLSMPRAYTPNIIEAGGMHIERKIRPLPEDIRAVLDNATDGAIYFSLGTNFKSKTMPPAKMKAILGTFAQLKQRVLWKLEDTSIPGIPSNVFISDWYPQNDVLAHANVKLFITHGGLLSTTETVYHGKPVVGIPLFGDQHMNMGNSVRSGIGLQLDYNELSAESFGGAISEVLNNSSYTKRVQEMSSIYRDQPLTPLETAIFWTEYVIRHKGAAHMRSPAMELNFWQYHSVDTIAVLVLLLLFLITAVILTVSVVLKVVLRRVFGRQPKVKKN